MNILSKICFILVLSACASVTSPTGGPRDKTPPELVTSSPSNNQKNFSGKSITVTFSEDIKLKDPKEEILIVPSVGKNTKYSVKKRKLLIEPELDWQPNTTYSINFREGVQDLTEGNPAENLRLAFSTGPTIDSLSIKGIVKEMFSEKIPTKMTVALYQSDTFDIFKHSPTYFTKSDKDGYFSIQNLKAGKYFVFAFDDKNKNLKAESKTEKFGFLLQPLDLPQPNDSVEIYMMGVDARPITITNIRHTDKTSRIRFNKQVDSLTVAGISAKESIYSFGADRAELIFYNSFPTEDSIKTNLTAKDSVGNSIDTVFYLKRTEIKTIAESFKTKEIELTYDVPTKSITHIIDYSIPLQRVNTDSIFIKYDSLTSTPIATKDFTIDTIKNRITIKSIVKEIQPEEKKKPITPQLTYGKGALISINQDSTKRFTKGIQLVKEDELGKVLITVQTKEPNYIVQLTTTDDKVVTSIKNVKEHAFGYLEPKEYKIRVIIDRNKNGKWDAGNFYQKIEPEKIILYKSEEGKYTFPLRANWEYGPLLIKF
jgi:uncharacterized protein (DUF2141 family)